MGSLLWVHLGIRVVVYIFGNNMCVSSFLPRGSSLTARAGALKLQVLFFYNRLSLDLLKPRTVNIVFVVTVLAYVVLILTISLTCRP